MDAHSTLLSILDHPTRPGRAAQAHDDEPQEGTLLRPPQALGRGFESPLPILHSSARSGHSLDLSGCFNVDSFLVATEQYANAAVTDDASAHFRRTGIDMVAVIAILSNPEQAAEIRPGRVVLQSRRKVDERMQLIRVFVDIDESPPRVVTASRASKIDKC